MKLIRQIALEYREGTSDKVYEVDLCEVGPDRFVVNFRFGRRGARLQEGSKTPLAVGRAEADRIFDKLVSEKTDKGYAERGAGPPAGSAEPAAAGAEEAGPKRVEDLTDPRHQRLLEILAAGGKGGWTTNVDPLIYRAGELRVAEAAGWIARFADGASDRRAWNVARALLRCGVPSTAPTALALARDPKRAGWVRSLAVHAAVALGATELVGEVREEIASAVSALEQGRLTALAGDLEDSPELLDQLYLVAGAPGGAPAAAPGSTSGNEPLRAKLLELLATIQLVGPSFGGVRRVYKAAEARGDGEVFGLLARRIERERCGGLPPKGGGGSGRFAMRFQRPKQLKPTGGSRKYLRRRSWRTLRRLGEARMAAEYCRMAAGLLLAYSDESKQQETSKKRRRSRAPAAWYTHDWALAQVLFSNGPGWTADGMRLKVARGRVNVPGAREERFPELWDDQPEVLAELLDRSRLAEVHAFAARALRANRPAWSRLPVPRLVAWFAAPYPETAELAAEVALTRYDPHDPDVELVLALITCPHERPRQTAEGWVKANPAPFLGSASFVTGIVLAPRVEARRFALELLGGATLRPDHARIVVDAIVDRALRTAGGQPVGGDPESDLILRDAAAVLLAGFTRELAKLDLERVAALVRHPSAGVAELGAKILLGHEVRAPSLPDDLLAAALTSVHPVVRGIGIRLYGELPDAVLAERFRVLVHLITNPNADVRYAVAPIVIRLVNGNPGFARVLLSALVPVLAAEASEGAEGMHRDVVRLLRTELAPALKHVDPGQVFRLLRASETVVQELGGDLLRTNVDPAGMTPHQLGILASSDVIGVRTTAFALLAHRVEAVRQSPEAVLPLLDARWEDSRERAFVFVEEQVGFDALTPEVALAVCDSVRPDVQAFGRRLVTRRFDHADGPRYLLRLAQHPSADMQGFVASWLEQHAAGDPERLSRLVPFFVSVLARPNKGRVAKVRVLQFLESQLADAGCAEVLAPVLGELVLTVATSHRARYVEMLATISRLHPQLPIPLRRVEPPVRGAGPAEPEVPGAV